MQALYFQIAARPRTLAGIQAREATMDRIRPPVIETRAIEDRHRAIATKPQAISRSIGAPQAERITSGILRELAEQMRHWD